MTEAATDLGPVVYEPPLTRSGPWGRQPKVLRTGPRWVRGASRWHRVRSGCGYPTHVSLHMWCGQAMNPHDRGTSDVVPADGLPLCGTCEGRAAGAGHTSPLGLPPEGLLFRPSRLTPPRWCPGSRHHTIHERVGVRVIRCGACGETVREKNASPWYDTYGVPQQHEPGPGLVPGCELHAWRHLMLTTEGVACQCAGIEEDDRGA
jgi:hypothetical protein